MTYVTALQAGHKRRWGSAGYDTSCYSGDEYYCGTEADVPPNFTGFQGAASPQDARHSTVPGKAEDAETQLLQSMDLQVCVLLVCELGQGSMRDGTVYE